MGSAASQRVMHRVRRCEALVAYGGTCACCGESREVVLSIDHIDPASKVPEDRKGLYARLRREGYPEGFQVLCYNCNLAKGSGAACPCSDSTTVAVRLAGLPSAEQRAHPNQGERQHLAVLTEGAVREIRLRYATSGVSMRALGDEYGVTAGAVLAVIHRRSWKQVA